MNPRILIYDIESSPLIGYTWSTWQTDVIEVIQDYQILTVAWQWLGEKKVHVIGQDDYKGYKKGKLNDKELLKDLWKLFDEADAVVAHNGDRFDQKKVRARMVTQGMSPPSPYKEIDTKKIAKNIGGFTSNSLKELAKQLDIAQKGDSGGFETWKGCLEGDKKAWKQMKKYNKQDIPPLADLYMKLRPWFRTQVQYNLATGKHEACPKCGAEGNMIKRGYTYRATTKYQRYQCQACKGWSQSRTPEPQVHKMEYK